MDQPNLSTPPPPPPAPQSKKGEAKNIVTIILLVLIPLVGIILMWVMATWSKKAKIIITVVLLLPMIAISGILSSIVLVSLGGAREAARDVRRTADIRQLLIAQEMYRSENGQYYQSVSYPSSIPNSISIMPTDPVDNNSYGWINNTGSSEQFCVYATLEKGGFLASSRAGTGKLTAKPLSLSDCEKVSGSYLGY